jgi:hypothetical protein
LDTDPLIEGPIANGYTQLSKLFKSKSPQYAHLSNQFLQLVFQLGLPFMNSAQCREIREQIMLMEKTFLEKINDPQFYQAYNNWLDLNDRRENEMTGFLIILNKSMHRKTIGVLNLIPDKPRRLAFSFLLSIFLLPSLIFS